MQVEGNITSAKLRELDFVAYEAMSGQAMLHRWGALAVDIISQQQRRV